MESVTSTATNTGTSDANGKPVEGAAAERRNRDLIKRIEKRTKELRKKEFIHEPTHPNGILDTRKAKTDNNVWFADAK